ncbi:MAG TPA: hypothetical protein VFY97_00610 [Rhodanobacteraceae bacterium]|nr:hypothetical protein [Rhodanobacteraceae bacterium]
MQAPRNPDPMTLAAGTWLAAGLVLYGLTPLPLRDATLGWSAAFWLLGAPALLLLAKRLLVSRRLPVPTRRQARPHRVGAQAKRHAVTASAPGSRARSRATRVVA